MDAEEAVKIIEWGIEWSSKMQNDHLSQKAREYEYLRTQVRKLKCEIEFLRVDIKDIKRSLKPEQEEDPIGDIDEDDIVF